MLEAHEIKQEPRYAANPAVRLRSANVTRLFPIPRRIRTAGAQKEMTATAVFDPRSHARTLHVAAKRKNR
jgi:hypothetical protein